MTKQKKQKPEEIKKVIDSVIKKLEKKGRGTREEIRDIWGRAAGKAALEHARPVNLKQKVLIVEVDSSTWLYALNLKKKNIINEIKKQVGQDKIEDIRLKIGEIN
ncbi:MAG: DUF721 domain-containing protein [Candidatus Omnitrophota bacterium]